MLVIALCLKRWINGERTSGILAFLGISAATYVGAIFFFKLFLAPDFSTYVDASFPAPKDFLPTVAYNYKTYATILRGDFKIEWLLCIAVLIAAFVFLCVKHSAHKPLPSLAVVIPSTILMALLSFGVYPAFAKPLFSPRAMYGVGIFISVLSILVCAFPGKNVLPKTACVLLGWSFFTFAFVYGNALHEQSEYTDFRIASVLDDLKDLNVQERTTVYISGTIGHAPVIKNMPHRWVIVRRLVPVLFNEGWMWGVYKLAEYYNLADLAPLHISFGEELEPNRYGIPFDTSAPSFVTLKDTTFHAIKTDGVCLVVELK